MAPVDHIPADAHERLHESLLDHEHSFLEICRVEADSSLKQVPESALPFLP
jgi:hypothetical protein